MINVNKVEFHISKYYTLGKHKGDIQKIKIIKILDENTALVQTNGKPFVKEIKFIFNEQKHAVRSGRDYENFMRKKRKEVKRKRKSSKNKKPISKDVENARDNITRMNDNQVVKLTNSKVGESDIRKIKGDSE